MEGLSRLDGPRDRPASKLAIATLARPHADRARSQTWSFSGNERRANVRVNRFTRDLWPRAIEASFLGVPAIAGSAAASLGAGGQLRRGRRRGAGGPRDSA